MTPIERRSLTCLKSAPSPGSELIHLKAHSVVILGMVKNGRADRSAQQWLISRLGDATAIAIGVTLLFPFAWLTNGFVTRRFGIDSSWPLGAIVAATTLSLLLFVDLVCLALLDDVQAKMILNHGEIEVRFVAQVFMSALPLALQGR